MIQVLAVQAVEKKTKFPEAVMVGNYECAYAAGYLGGKFNILTEVINSADDLRKCVEEILSHPEPEDAREKRIFEMLKGYEVTETFDPDVSQLYTTGRLRGTEAT